MERSNVINNPGITPRLETYLAKPNLWICAFDLHYPKVHKPTFNAMLDFIEQNTDKIAGFYFGGDQLDNEEISHHNAGKPLFKPVGSYDKNTQGFEDNILAPLEQSLPADATCVWQIGNHDHWETQFIESHPEFQGMLERPKLLELEDRGWKVIPCGEGFKLGKLQLIHGETLSGIGNQAPGYHAKKAVETYCGSVLFGHMHAPQTFTKILPHSRTDKWQGTCAPILGAVNPSYLRNRPTAWLNGFCIVELGSAGTFNLYSVIVVNGKFSFGGVTYGGSK